MRRYARQRVRALVKDDLSVYLLKKDSPSCGMERVKVWPDKGPPERTGRGLFAAELLRQYPNMPVAEEDGLHRPRQQENFVERVFMYRGLHTLFSAPWTIGQLVQFHHEHKQILASYSIDGYGALSQLVAEGTRISRAELARRYEDGVMTAMARPWSGEHDEQVLGRNRRT